MQMRILGPALCYSILSSWLGSRIMHYKNHAMATFKQMASLRTFFEAVPQRLPFGSK